MKDPVLMYHPGLPGDEENYVERAAYRGQWYPKGWRSLDDAGYAGTIDVPVRQPGELLFKAVKSDALVTVSATSPTKIAGWSGAAVVPNRGFSVRADVAGFSGNVPVTAGVRASNVVTLTVPTGHGIAAGEPIVVKMADITYNGTFVVTGATATTITYAQTAADDASAGTGTVSPPMTPKAGGSMAIYADIPVLGASRTSNVITLTLPVGHGLLVGADVILDLTDNTFDTSGTITGVTATTATIAQTAANDADGGTGIVSVRIGVVSDIRAAGTLSCLAHVPDKAWAPAGGLPFTLAPRVAALNAATPVTLNSGPLFGTFQAVLTAVAT